MRRVLVAAAAATLAAMTLFPSTAAASAEKSTVCHSEGNGTFHEISVADAALETHIAHGDGEVGEAVQGQTGMVFDADCTPVESGPTYPSADCVVYLEGTYVDFEGGYSLVWFLAHQFYESDCTGRSDLLALDLRLVYAPDGQVQAPELCLEVFGLAAELENGAVDVWQCRNAR